MWARWGVRDYRAAVREWRKHFRKELGKYNLKAVQYRYRGDDSSGVVYILYKGKEHGGWDVILENGVWKIRGGD